MKLDGEFVGLILRRDGAIYDERTVWSFTNYESWYALAYNHCFAGRGRFIFCAVVLVVTVLAGLSRRHQWCGALALDWGRPISAGFCGGVKMHLGFRMDRTRNACANCSPSESGSGGILSICAEPHVLRLHCGLIGAVGGLWTSEPGNTGGGLGRRGRSGLVCAVLRGADSAKDVRRGIRRIL